MTEVISTERVFSLPCFEGLRLLRYYKQMHPALGTAELIALVESIEADGASLDLVASAYLETLIDKDCSMDGALFYQACVKAVLLKHQPVWSMAMRSGRARFIRTLDLNDQDVFSAAGLMDNPPSIEVIRWWDDVSGHARLIADQEKMQQGRAAELLTLEHERGRLADIGIAKEPEWPGLDDNYAGYDVLSYDLGEYGLDNRMIEVKSTTASPLRFFVSRTEWNTAERAASTYLFHIWDMNQVPAVLHVRTVAEVAPHIPTDNEKGAWRNAQIPIVNS